MTSWLISTDLDGTLLNHHNYEYQPVLPVLKQLEQLAIPVILNSSKTFAELADWRQKLQLEQPVICENGGVIHLPGESSLLVGRDRNDILDILHQLRNDLGWSFEGFADWTVEQVMQHTGLSHDEAARAKLRETTEPILWQDGQPGLVVLQKHLAEQGLQLQKGGRFYHVMAAHDKGQALKDLIERFALALWGRNDFKLMALGDGENDRSQLEIADIAVVMPNAQQQYLTLNTTHQVYQAKQAAPFGWVEAVTHFILREGE